MPALSAFPMAHQVTFKYYAGVIYFLEEAYQDVSPHHIPKNCCPDADPTPLRQKNTSQKHSNYVTKMPSATKSESTTYCLTWSHIASFKTNKSQVNSHLPHPLPPPNHTHTSHPHPPLTLPSAPNPIPSSVPLYQKGRPIRLRRCARGGRGRVHETPHLPNRRTSTRHCRTESSPEGIHCRWLRRGERCTRTTSATDKNSCRGVRCCD